MLNINLNRINNYICLLTHEFQSEALELWVVAALEDSSPSSEKIQALEEILPRPEFVEYFDGLYPNEGKIHYALVEDRLNDLVDWPWCSDVVGGELGKWWSDNKEGLSAKENRQMLQFVIESEDEELQAGFFEALEISKKQVLEVLDQVAEILPPELQADLSEVADKVAAVGGWN